MSKEAWKRGVWLKYVQLAVERGAFRGVVACTTLLDAASVKWVMMCGGE